ncbi:MAG: URC4/urg3 family protein [Thermostichus sp. DG02_5_bins_236]
MLTGVDLEKRVAYFRTPQAIRDRCKLLFERILANESEHFSLALNRLESVADYVITTLQAHYPTGEIPFHSRWRHFQVGCGDRLARLENRLKEMDPKQRLCCKWDLTVISVVLDAGAGPAWVYRDPESGQKVGRSEGLALASFDWFWRGGFSSDPQSPLQVDAAGLEQMSLADLAAAFQVGSENPLLGLEGRWQLLQRLAQALRAQPQGFGVDCPRPGRLWEQIQAGSSDGRIQAAQVLQAVLAGFGSIWPGRVSLAGIPLGDVWPYPHLPQTEVGSDWVPFHKLSQWMTYSLLEPLQQEGIPLEGLEELTGLAEYRNGGLFVDLGVIQLKQPEIARQLYPPGSTVIVEWRALTVILLDRLATLMREKLGRSPQELPLVKILQGGTWTAGRALAAQLRPNATPPIQLLSDGTVF